MTSFKKRPNRKNIRERKEWRDEEDAPTIINEKSTKPSSLPKATLLSFEDEIEEGEEFKVKKSSLSRKLTREREIEEQKKKEEKLIKEAIDDNEGVAEGEGSVLDRLHAGIVPDATMIHAIRKKRQLVRERGVASTEYLPLEQTEKKSYKAVSGKSRLIREDENDKSDEDEEDGGVSSHMTFGRKVEPGRQLQVLSALENLESGSEDEETQRWEEEQISKGMKASNPPVPIAMATAAMDPVFASLDPFTQSFMYSEYQEQHQMLTEYQQQQQEQGRRRLAQSRPTPDNLVPITIESLKSKLSTQLQEMKDSLSNHERQLEQVTADLQEASIFIEGAESSYSTLEQQYSFYQQMKGYLTDLLTCLAIKAPLVKALEAKILGVHSKHSLLLINRRRQDVRDESEECLGAEGNEQRRVRGIEREARRRRRREKRERQEVTEHTEGVSSDEELLETDRLEFVNELDSLKESIQGVFSDVVDDFSDLNVIKARFEQWKFTQSSGYQQAYVSLCLTKIIAPYIRYEMLHWNPLEPNSTSIETMNWFHNLLSYSYQKGIDPDPSDDDTHLIPHAIERVVLSKLIAIIERVWDPLSSSQTQCLVENVHYILEEFPVSSPQTKNLQELRSSLVKRFQESLNEDAYIPLMTESQLESTGTQSFQFYQRQYWKCIKLLGNILCCQGILSDELLQKLIFDGLISRYLLLSLQNSPLNELTVQKLTNLLHQLPKEWLLLNNKSMQSIRRYLTHLMESIDTKAMSYTSEHLRKTARQLKVKLVLLEKLVKI